MQQRLPMHRLFVGLIILILPLLMGTAHAADETSRPNIIFVLCDDLGWGDLGVTWQNQRDTDMRFTTPSLDAMAAGGALLTAHYCPAPVCAPSRASLLTGLHQGHATIRNGQFDKALPESFNLASALKQVGYRTALIGKYGLQGTDGNHPEEWPAYPTKRGFDDFLGYVRHRDGHVHYPAHSWGRAHGEGHRSPKELWHNEREISGGLTKCFTSDLFTAYAKHWITKGITESPEQPFFIYLAYDTPHAALQLPPCPYPDGGGRAGGVQWLGEPGKMINTAIGTVDGWVHPEHANLPEAQQRQAGMIRRIDDHIADLLHLLRDLGIAENTLVVFSSDNGPHSESYGKGLPYTPELLQSYGPLSGIKRDTLEGGIRVPTIAYWPGVIPADQQLDQHSQFHDWLNTFLDVAGAPMQARSDGVSLMPSMTQQDGQEPPITYVEFANKGTTPKYDDFPDQHHGAERGEMQVIFLDGYKGIRRNIQSADDDFQIFDVAADAGERNDLSKSSPAFIALNDRMKQAVLQLRRPNPSAKRPYDDAPVPAVDVDQLSDGVLAAIMPGSFPWVPRRIAQHSDAVVRPTPDAEVSVTEPSAIEISGYVVVDQDGSYTCTVTSPDACVLHIHRALVIDGDTPGPDGGEHAATINLTAGAHPFRLRYLSDGPVVNLVITGPGAVQLQH